MGTGTVKKESRKQRALFAASLYGATFLILLVLNFLLPRTLPGDPIIAMQDPSTPSFVSDEALRDQLRAYYGLDRPLVEQFGQYLVQLSGGDLGTSIRYRVPVLEVIRERLPWTLLLAVAALSLSGVAGILGGIHSAWRRGRRSDRTLLALFLGLRNLAPFFVGSLLLLLFSVKLGWFPLSGATTQFAEMNPVSWVADVLWHLVHLQYRFRVVSYSSGHEISNLRTFTFGKGA